MGNAAGPRRATRIRGLARELAAHVESTIADQRLRALGALPLLPPDLSAR